MKLIVLLLTLFLITSNAMAGGYYSGVSIDEYDISTGLYFKSVKNAIKEGGFLSKGSSKNYSDINIFNPKTGSNVLVFNDKKHRKITSFVYESQYQAETYSILFGSTKDNYSYNRHIKNNYNVKERELKNRLLLVVYDEDQELFEMWSLDKTGNNRAKIKTFDRDINWHIDVKNSKIRFISNIQNNIKIESLDW